MTVSESALARCALFQEMAPEERRQVLGLLEHEVFPEGEVVLLQGRSTQYLWVIVRGRCEVVRTMKTGTEQRFAVLESGAVFGEMSFFNPAPHSASVRTLTEVEVLRLSRTKFEELERDGQRIAHRIAASTAKILAERLRRMDDWMCDLVERPEAAKHREEWHEFRSKLYSDWQF